MIIQKYTRLQQNIVILLCNRVGTTLSQVEIANELKVTSSAVKKALLLLEQEGLVKISKLGKIKLLMIELNRDNGQSIEVKRVENLKNIYKSKLLDYLEENFPGSPIILFGSYSRGEDTTKSDIDIGILDSKNKRLNLEHFEKILEREINIQNLPKINKVPEELRFNIYNGVVLSGAIS